MAELEDPPEALEQTPRDAACRARAETGPLAPKLRTLEIRPRMPGDVLLNCGECHCASDDHAKGWAAFTCEDPEGIEPTSVVIVCPLCAAREFGWRPETAARYE